MKTKTVMSAGSKEDLAAMINEYYYSKNYIITDDNRIYNTAKEKFLDGMKVVFKRNRWRVERTEEWIMTVKAFFNMMDGIDEVNVDLYEINENVQMETTSEIITRNDGLHEEWKNAEIQSWCIIDNNYISLTVIK